MKLFLSSEGVVRPDLLRRLIGVSEDEAVKVAMINNAQDTYPENLAKQRGLALAQVFRSLNFQVIGVDLRAYFGKTEELSQILKTCKLVWCSGGNVFWLRYVMKMSGFDRIIRSLLAEGTVYGGWSAGSVVAGSSLKVIDLMDDPNEAPEIIWEGLGLVDCCVWPHWNKEKYISLQTKALERMKIIPHESIILKDGDVLIVEDEKRQIICGEGC